MQLKGKSRLTPEEIGRPLPCMRSATGGTCRLSQGREEAAKSPLPLTFLPVTPGPEEPTIPTGHDMPGVLKIPPAWEMLLTAGNAGKEGESTTKHSMRIQKAQARFKAQNPLGAFLAKAQKAREAWTEK